MTPAGAAVAPATSKEGLTILVLTRRRNDAIQIGADIRIVIVSIDRGRVRIGIDCAKDINIVREELLLKQQREPKSAT